MTVSAAKAVTCRLVADVALLARGGTVLVRYRDPSRYDDQDGWFLPDDYIAIGEHPDRAARRILAEQIAVSARPRLSFIESFDGEPWHLIFHYVTRLPRRAALRPSSAVLEAKWFALDDLPSRRDVAHEGWAIDVLRRLRRSASS